MHHTDDGQGAASLAWHSVERALKDDPTTDNVAAALEQTLGRNHRFVAYNVVGAFHGRSTPQS